MGPPPSNCVQTIRQSLLRDSGSGATFRRRMACRLSPEEGVPFLQYARDLLEQSGIAGLEELRGLPGLPRQKLLCRQDADPGEGMADGDPLLHAAILGMCNGSFYSPDRPIVWTESRLRRRLELFSVEGFYEH